MANAETRIREAASRKAQVVCLQELFRTEYFCREERPLLFDFAEQIPGPTSSKLSMLAKELSIVVVGSVFEKRSEGLYHNTALVFDADGSLVGVYRKMHIPHDPLFFEKYYFTPGDLGFRCFTTRFARLATLVCWDQWYPEAARLAAMGGAQILLFPTAIGWRDGEKDLVGASQFDAWRTIQRSHAIANGIFVGSTNRVGHEGLARHGIEFWGGSFVVDPYGKVLVEASQEREETLIVDCHVPLIEQARRDWPFFRDRRIDAFGDLLNRWGNE